MVVNGEVKQGESCQNPQSICAHMDMTYQGTDICAFRNTDISAQVQLLVYYSQDISQSYKERSKRKYPN